MAVRDRVVAITGAVVIVLAAVGVTVVESRAGPFEYEAEPAPVPVRLGAISEASGGPHGIQLADGSCLPVPPALACSPAFFHLDLVLLDLPPLAPPLAYVAFLAGGPTGERKLGPFSEMEGGHQLDYRGDHDREGHDRVRIVLALSGQSSAASVVVPVGAVLLDDTSHDMVFQGPAASGSITLHQIGAVTVSATVTASLAGLPPLPSGLVYQAWLLRGAEGGVPGYTDLGPLSLDSSDAGAARLDGRVERVHLMDQDAFLVTLEPGGAATGHPVGFPLIYVPL